MKRIGFIGLGNMGSHMVNNLLKGDYEVIGYDINNELIEKLLPKGLKKAYDLNDLSKDTDLIITMLPNGNNVKDVCFNSDGLIRQDRKEL